MLLTTAVAVGQSSLSSQLPDADTTLEPAAGLPPGSDLSPRTFTLQELQTLAFRHNPTLVAAAARMNAASGRQLQAGLYPNPIVGYHGMEVGNLGTPGQQGAFINQRFITGGKLKLDQAAAGKEKSEAHFRLHAQEQRILTDVEIRFYQALAAQQRLNLTRELLRIGNNLVTATEKLLEGRQRTENDLLQAQIRVDEAEILLDNSGNELNETWRRLMAVVGTPKFTITPLDGDLKSETPDLDWDETCSALLAGHPELNAARARAERARILIVRAKKEPVPNLDLMVSVRHVFPTDSDVANVQAGIPIPIFNRNQGNIVAAETEWIAAFKEIERIELQLQDGLATAYRRYANARQQVAKYADRIVPRAERSLTLVTRGYETGQVEYLTLLVAQQTYLQAHLSWIDSLRELHTSSALIKGQLLEGSLSAAVPGR